LFDNILAAQARPHDNGKTLAAEVVDHGQQAETVPIEERIADEIHAPALVECGEHWSIQPVRSDPARAL